MSNRRCNKDCTFADFLCYSARLVFFFHICICMLIYIFLRCSCAAIQDI
uniref:Uncharacterized protein n=1 Tax=Arundo donax TaxID=35708 RepID=A0A0A8ZW57_ARUDO